MMKKAIVLCISLIGILCFHPILSAQNIDDRLDSLGIELPEVDPPIANYVKWRRTGNLLFISGHVPPVKGKLGRDLTIEQGYQAARQTGISILSTIRHALGNLDQVAEFIKVDGMVNCTPEFYDQSLVINGFSDLMVEVFGEAGKHARVALGQSSLPGNSAVEIAVILRIK